MQMPLLYRNWHMAWRCRLLPFSVNAQEIKLHLRQGVSFSVHPVPADVILINEIWTSHVYEPEPAFKVVDGWTVLDLGANKGIYTVRAALSGSKTRVHAVEPVSDNIRLLRNNIHGNGIENVTVYESAIATSTGKVSIHLAVRPDAHSLLLERVSSVSQTVAEVEAISLEDVVNLVGAPIDLLKVDIEGAEFQVLTTAPSATWLKIRRIVVECHDTSELPKSDMELQLEHFLAAHGFRCGFSDTYGRLLYGISL